MCIVHPGTIIRAGEILMNQKKTRIGIMTVSDRASSGQYDDLSGPAIADWLQSALKTPWEPVMRLVADEQPAIELALKALCDDEGCCLVVTTGGTGPALRDVTLSGLIGSEKK